MVKVKVFFKKVGLWFKNHAPTKRRLIQIYAALLYNANIKGFVSGRIYQGSTKKACVPGFNCYSCPGAIGACPLGALQDSLANSNTTAPYYILGILGLFGLILARTICGFFCPVGLGQELLYKIKTPKLKKSRYTRFASYLKYILLIVLVIAIPLIYNNIPAFCKYVCPAGTFGGAGGILSNPNNADKFDQLGYLFVWKFSLMVGFIIASIFIYRFFCRFFCPLGAIYGFFNKIALIGVKLDKSSCIDCGMCLETCKMDIKHVGDHECISCGECIPVCPTKAISWKGSKIIVNFLSKGTDKEEPAEAPLAEVAGGAKEIAAVEAESTSAVTVVIPESPQTQPTAEPVEAVEAEKQSAEAEKQKAERTAKIIKKRSFWLQFSAWALALVVLVGVLVFYNFIDKSALVVDKVYKEGDIAPDFTFGTVYETNGSLLDDGTTIEDISLYDFRDKVVVLNFWYTTCGPCVAEIPYFEAEQNYFGEDIQVIFVHINNSATDEAVQKKIDDANTSEGKASWSNYNSLFVHDTLESQIYFSVGGDSICPMTVILNEEGMITFRYVGKISEKLLRSEIQSALNS